MSTSFNTRALTQIALMTAVLCILGPLAIPLPFSPVPISLTQIGIYLAIYTLGYQWATGSTLLYLLLGGVGLPVFSGFTGGVAKLAGPTGGYLIGFVFLALIAGYFLDKHRDHLGLCILGLVIGNFVCYAMGTLWLSHTAGLVIKSALALVFGPRLRKAVKKYQ